MRQYPQPHPRARLVPHPVVVRRNDMKLIIPRLQVTVMRQARGTRVHPFLVKSLELVAEMDFFGVGQRQGGVMEFDILPAWRHIQRGSPQPGLQFGHGPRTLPVGLKFLNYHRRGPGIDRHFVRIHAHHAFRGGKPKLAVATPPSRRLVHFRTLQAREAVGEIVHGTADSCGLVRGKRVQR